MNWRTPKPRTLEVRAIRGRGCCHVLPPASAGRITTVFRAMPVQNALFPQAATDREE